MAMNLGEERLHAVTASRPELVHTSSAHSIAASDDYYYSFSDRSSPDFSDEATTVIRHQSPEETRQLNSPRPQQPATALHQPSHPVEIEPLQPARHREFPLAPSRPQPTADLPEQPPLSPSEATVRHVSSIYAGDETPRPTTMVSAIDDSTPVPRPVSHLDAQQASRASLGPVIAEQSIDRQHPMSSAGATVLSRRSAQASNHSSLPGSGAGPTPPPKHANRGWSNQIGQPVPTPGIDATPELHFALDQITRDEEVRGIGRYSTESWGAGVSRPDTRDSIRRGYVRTSDDPRTSRGSDTRPLVAAERPKSFTPPRKPVPVSATPEGFVTTPAPEIIEFPSDARAQAKRESAQSWLNAASDADADFKKDAKFNSVPGPLRPMFLVPLIILCMFILAGLTVSSVHSALSYGMNTYDGTGTSLYFVYRYLAQLLAAVTIVWLHVVQSAVQRILPFVLIRSRTSKSRGEVLRSTPLFLSNFLLPNFAPFQDGEVGLGLCNLVFWLALFTVPLASALYTPRYLSYSGHGYWVWSTVQAVCWALIPIYFLLIIALIFVLLKFNLRPTGLRWDPRSIADILVLLRRLNGTITRRSTGTQSAQFDYRPASLGLWRSSSQPEALSYGIGIPRDIETGLATVPQPPSYRSTLGPRRINPDEGVLQHHSTFESWKSGRNGRGGWLPWFLRPSPVALWIAITLVLFVAFMIVSWVNRAVEKGFDPQLSAGPRAALNFSSANFLWSFLPSLLGMFLYLFWLPFDAYFRALQPYADMQAEPGAEATKSVLLEYSAQIPFSVSIHALANRHYRVAWISFVPLIAITIPVLAGGVFQAQYVVGTDNVIHEIASLPGYVALCVFLGVYAFSYPILLPNRKRRLPENIKYVSTLGDFVIGGKMMDESVWRGPQTKSDLVGRLMSKGFTGEKSNGNDLFHFGYYVDADGRDRVGIYRH